MHYLNLAGRPFVNVKPVRRAGLLMLVLAAGMTLLNGALYWQHFSGENETRGKSQELTQKITEEEAEIERLRRQIASVDLDLLNQRARSVNMEIDRRGFSWSRLFDQLVEAQPSGVRLVTMSPQFAGDRRRASRVRPAPEEVSVELLAVARNGTSILEFIDGLFQHPAFREPDIRRETQYEDKTIGFDITVLYDPDAPPLNGDPEVLANDDADEAEESAAAERSEA